MMMPSSITNRAEKVDAAHCSSCDTPVRVRPIVHARGPRIRYEEDLIDQLFNSSEKRLARILLLLARFGKEGQKDTVIPKVSQEMLAEMVGTTRSRVSFFMNRFRKLGFIDYNGGMEVHSSLLNVVLHD
jgi:CRP/FNR family cyclic AMP-dependent transcriptional regulator